VEERARHSGVDEGDGAKKRGTAVADAFYVGPVAQAERKKGRGVWGSASCGGGKQRRGLGFGDMDWHNTDVVAPGCSDSSGWHKPHGRGLQTGEDGGVRDAGIRG
jgi:hypothetical protein